MHQLCESVVQDVICARCKARCPVKVPDPTVLAWFCDDVGPGLDRRVVDLGPAFVVPAPHSVRDGPAYVGADEVQVDEMQSDEDRRTGRRHTEAG